MEKLNTQPESRVKIQIDRGGDAGTFFRSWKNPDKAAIRNVPTFDSTGRQVHESVSQNTEAWWDLDPELAAKLEKGAEQLDTTVGTYHECVVKRTNGEQGDQISWQFVSALPPVSKEGR